MIRIFKLFWNKRNVANELIKILDECQKENELLRKQAFDFRARAIAAELKVAEQYDTLSYLRTRLNIDASAD